MQRRGFIGILGASTLLSGCGVLQGTSTARDPAEGIVMRPEPQKSAQMTELLPEEDKIFLSGAINSDTALAFNTVRAANPQTQTVVFLQAQGAPGSAEALELGRAIRQAGMSTHLRNDSVISGGAIDAYLGGTERTLEQGAVVEIARSEIAPADHTAFVQEMLGSDGYAKFAQSYTRRRPHAMTIAELGAMGVVSSASVDTLGPGFIVSQG